MAVHRSFLFAPANHARRVEKALGLGADAVILDLEDAVAVAEKPAARKKARAALDGKVHRGRVFVRVNALDTAFCFQDILETAGPWLDGLVVPKIETPAQLMTVDWLLSNLEREQNMAPGSIEVMPIVETANGIGTVREIAAVGGRARVRRLSFGAADYAKDMGLQWTRDETEMAPARAEIVLASRMYGLEPPVDSVWVHLDDADGLVSSARRVRDMGFQGKLCIHPDQLPAVNRAFTPPEAEVKRARAIIDAFEQAERDGAAAVQLDGYFIDYPVVDQARRTLALWESIQAQSAG